MNKINKIPVLLILVLWIITIGTVVAKENVITVKIDIKPSINLGSNGNIPVVILGNPILDVTKIDPKTVTLAGAWIKSNKDCKPMVSIEDTNNDGIKDMVAHIETYALQLTEKDTQAVLEGKTYDGTSIRGTDSVKIIGHKPDKVKYVTNECIKPSVSSVPGLNDGPSRIVGSVINPDNTKEEFITDEVSFAPKDQNDLNSFLTKYKGTVINKMPIPPSGTSYQYLIRIDPKSSSLDDLTPNMETLGFKGYYTFSSEDAARLIALAAREANKGVSPNFLMYAATIPEHPDGKGGNLNAEDWWWLNDQWQYSTGVIRAWQYLKYVSPNKWIRTRIAIVDSGFALDDTTGVPLNNNKDFGNSLNPPWQMDSTDGDNLAGGKSYIPCDTKVPVLCAPWHGQGSFGIATAYPGNYYGSAGTGGDRVEPMLIKTGPTLDDLGNAVLDAAYNGADVISMSTTAECGWVCQHFGGYDYLRYGLSGASKNSIIVSAAGNLGKDISTADQVPCTIDKYVICVGSVDYNGNNLYNYGSKVHIWAPTGMFSTVTPDTANNVGESALYKFGGTSASTPFVSGVVALMKTLDHDLDMDTVRKILIDTSTKSPDPKVRTGIINAYDAVNIVRPNKPPTIKITQPLNGATVSYGGTFFSADVSDPESPNIFGGKIRWTDGLYDFCTQTICSNVKLSIGQHTIYARAWDPFGAMGMDSITINVVNHPPTIKIESPTDGSTFYSNQIIKFGANAWDADQDPTTLKVSWSSDIDGPLGEGTTIKKSLSIGTHKITATVTDELNAVAQDTITVNILSGAGYPTVKILNPPDNSRFTPGTLISFEGSATDPKDGTLSGSALEWYSDRDGFLGTGNKIQKVLSGPAQQCNPEYKTHIVSLKATDSDGHQITEQITVRVGTLC